MPAWACCIVTTNIAWLGRSNDEDEAVEMATIKTENEEKEDTEPVVDKTDVT